MIIEIVHPDEFSQNKWEVVETLSSEEGLGDFLKFPTFEWTPGTIVRANHYIGIFGQQFCVDVSGDSDFMGKREGRGLSFPTTWHQSMNPVWMMNAVARILPRKDLTLVCCKLLNFVVENNDGLYRRAIQQTEGFLNGTMTREDLQAMRIDLWDSHEGNGDGFDSNTKMAVWYMFFMTYNRRDEFGAYGSSMRHLVQAMVVRSENHSPRNSRYHYVSVSNVLVATKIRQLIQFSEIASRIDQER